MGIYSLLSVKCNTMGWIP